MIYRPEQPQDEFQDQLPPKLVDDLQSLYSNIRPGSKRDHRILASAHAEFANRNRYRLWRRWGTAAAAVAAILLLALLLLPNDSNRPPQADRSSPLPVQEPIARTPDSKDLNTDGRVNILDAYLLATQVQRLEKLDRAMDFNADGTVNQTDADVIAAAAVQLEGGDLQ